MPLLKDAELAALERLEYDYWRMGELSDGEFARRYGRSRVDYWKVRDMLVALRAAHLRAQDKIFEEIERKHGTIDRDRQREAEQDLENFDRAVNAVRSSALATAFVLYSASRGGSVKDMADAGDMGLFASLLAGGALAAYGSYRARQVQGNYRGSAGLTSFRGQEHGLVAETRATDRPETAARLQAGPAPSRDPSRFIGPPPPKVTRAPSPAGGSRETVPAAGKGGRSAAGAPARGAGTSGPVDPDATPVHGTTRSGKPVIRIERPVIEPGPDQFKASWPGDPNAVAVIKEVGEGIEIAYINAGAQTGQGAALLVNALRRASEVLGKPGLAQPAFLHSSNVINTTIKDLVGAGRMQEAKVILRRSAVQYAQALGGTAGTPTLTKVGDKLVSDVPIVY